MKLNLFWSKHFMWGYPEIYASNKEDNLANSFATIFLSVAGFFRDSCLKSNKPEENGSISLESVLSTVRQTALSHPDRLQLLFWVQPTMISPLAKMYISCNKPMSDSCKINLFSLRSYVYVSRAMMAFLVHILSP